MKARSVLVLIAVTLLGTVFVCGAFAQTSTSVTYTYTQIDYPGATSTQANGINNGKIIVGSYLDSSNVSHGFRYANGSFTTVDFPGAAATAALGINDVGDIVGWYQLSGSSNPHGFLRHNGTFTTIDDPSATFGTAASGINKSGRIVGSFDNSQGFVYQNGTYTTLNAPQQPGEPIDTQLNGINNSGEVVGQVFSGDNWRGFWVTGGEFDFFQPLFSLDNQVTGVNSRGDIVGCHDFNNPFIAFNPEAGEGSESSEKFPSVESLPNPLNPTSCPRGINYSRLIVGILGQSPNPTHGYLAVPVLTLNVTSPVNNSNNANPVHVAATASGSNPIAQIQVWVNSKEIYHVTGGTLNTSINLPVGTNEHFVVQAVDSNGTRAKVVETISVH